ncbi:hypothetical protein ACGF13_21510 [Kitasatospora sp. NPDC048286]|uniref:hypothetical protein n=1 Tax=Kitasatospora sp. NPDC048286 TaxID=3364047 RepID=UPI0037169A34
MVTARSPLRTRRARPRGAAARLFWLGALLAAVFAAHGFGVENGAGHTDPIRIVWSAQTEQAAPTDGGPQAQQAPQAPQPTLPAQHQEHDEDADHPGGECLSGKPEDAPRADAARSAVAVQPALGDVAPAPGRVAPTAGSAESGAPELPHLIALLRI